MIGNSFSQIFLLLTFIIEHASLVSLKVRISQINSQIFAIFGIDIYFEKKEAFLGPDKKKSTSDKPGQVRRCAQGHERRFQLGEGENNSWRYDFFSYELTKNNLCLLCDMIFCSGERSRTQAELAALREARSTQMEELDPLYSTRQVQRNIV